MAKLNGCKLSSKRYIIGTALPRDGSTLHNRPALSHGSNYQTVLHAGHWKTQQPQVNEAPLQGASSVVVR